MIELEPSEAHIGVPGEPHAYVSKKRMAEIKQQVKNSYDDWSWSVPPQQGYVQTEVKGKEGWNQEVQWDVESEENGDEDGDEDEDEEGEDNEQVCRVNINNTQKMQEETDLKRSYFKKRKREDVSTNNINGMCVYLFFFYSFFFVYHFVNNS